MLFEIIEKELQKENIEFLKLTGQTKVSERINLVDEFNSNPNKKLFLITLKAGGTGLNLTSAENVIHYDPWWNVAAQNQATDRTHRIGQKNVVTVYELIAEATIEEQILNLQKAKSDLVEEILSGDGIKSTVLNRDELLQML